MEKLVIFIALALSAVLCNAQEIIELEEAKVEFNPVTQNITNDGNSFSVYIKESYSGEFQKDPLAFAKKHFDIKEVIKELGDDNYKIYRVSFVSKRGELNVHFDRQGRKTGSNMRFEDIAVPYQLQHQMYRDFKGWTMTKTTHIASESMGRYKKDFYKITIRNGNQKKKLKINTSDIGNSTLVALK